MTTKLTPQEISSLLHVGINAANIYMLLITNGALPAKKIKELLEISADDLKKSLSELEFRNLAFETIIDDKAIYEAASLMQLEDKATRDQDTINALRGTIIPSIQAKEKINLVRYEGFEGIRKVYIEILEEAIKNKEPILAFENNEINAKIGTAFFDNYIKKRVQNKVEALVICPKGKADKEYQENFESKYTKIKLIDDFPIGSNVNITGKLVMTFSASPAQGTLRSNQQEAETLKAVFHKLWKSI
jgi:hypothetical protein